ncbi:MAG: hypothetical protein JW384_00901 [Nitrosomonadaceae bacterium]|jgi:hypothetical protein|nr:hypothetical protein [Nitrosomonadaceae bacterium]
MCKCAEQRSHEAKALDYDQDVTWTEFDLEGTGVNKIGKLKH